MEAQNPNVTIGEIIAKDFRTSAVFTKYGIDFCCGGDKELQAACAEHSVDPAALQKDIDEVTQTPNTETDFKSWPLDELIDYVEKTYHSYIKEKSPLLLQYLKKIYEVHGSNHPELGEIYGLYSHSANDLGQHLMKEERVLFPLIRDIVKAKETGQPLRAMMSVQNPVMGMMSEHVVEGDRFHQMSELSSGYTVPADGCNTYRAAYGLLCEFEQKLHEHIAIENNILFPRAVEEEKALMGR
ncbi:MAG: iron-sulfur cluster repair di-iron protein [Tannerella sp.]|jgi:regulator of cell morphogenesis and NO signaling|nr:iron-sulfur cluster repair di-iron protein [Tannerella sp.]